MTEQHGPLVVTRSDGVASVVIDHPPTNLVDGQLLAGLHSLLESFAAQQPRVVVFSSADPDFFLMHGDVQLLVGLGGGSHQPVDAPNAAAAMFHRLHAAPYLTIGLVNGAARGGGAEFLAALDLRIGSTRAVLGQPEVPMGILPGAGGTARLPHLLGRARALEVILTGRDLIAEEALAIGWLDAVVDHGQLESYGRQLATRVAAMPAESIAAVKRVVDVSLTGGVRAGLLTETNALGELIAAGTHREPMRRFLAAGGQTRVGETTRMSEIVDAMLEG